MIVTGPMQSHYRRLAQYNTWANRRLFAACAELPAAEYLAERPAFFGSLHGTLSHILVVDRLWLARIEDKAAPHGALDELPYGDLAGLRVARAAEDAQIITLVGGLDEADLERIVAYGTMAGERQQDPLGDLLAHLFNHATHHRGQAHDQLSQTAVAPPALDFIYFLRAAENG